MATFKPIIFETAEGHIKSNPKRIRLSLKSRSIYFSREFAKELTKVEAKYLTIGTYSDSNTFYFIFSREARVGSIRVIYRQYGGACVTRSGVAQQFRDLIFGKDGEGVIELGDNQSPTRSYITMKVIIVNTLSDDKERD